MKKDTRRPCGGCSPQYQEATDLPLVYRYYESRGYGGRFEELQEETLLNSASGKADSKQNMLPFSQEI